VSGTIEASIETIERLFYGGPSEALVSGAPVAASEPAPEPVRSRLRAKDLIAELDSINGQIHKMMFQVERAVARLATSG
jgi:hypothetical protein